MHKYTVVKNPVRKVDEMLKAEDEMYYEQYANDIVERVKREKDKGNDSYEDIWIGSRKIKEVLKVVFNLHVLLPDCNVYLVTDYKNNKCLILVEWVVPIEKIVTKNKKINIFKSLFRPSAT